MQFRQIIDAYRTGKPCNLELGEVISSPTTPDPSTQEGVLIRRIGVLERALGMRKQEVSQLRLLSSRAKRWEYGSLTHPMDDWADQWKKKTRRVLLFATRDYSGSFFEFAMALNRTDDWAARLVVIHPHPYGYENDITYGAPTLIPSEFDELLEDADVVHLKDEGGFLDGSNLIRHDLFSRHSIPVVFHLYGGVARRLQDDQGFRDHLKGYESLVSVTPDLCFPWLDNPNYIPHAVDVEATPSTWHDGRVVGHSPSTRARKGTDAFVSAVGRIPQIDMELIEGVSNSECVRRKSEVSLFFDQAGIDTLADNRIIGWYGVSALEAVARGIPTLAHLSTEAFDGAFRGGHQIRQDCPIIDTGLTEDSIESAIRFYYEMPSNERAALSQATRAWAKDFHDYPVIASQLSAVYTSVL